ncbi:hypothetical protein BN948_01807 [Hydrogenophaga intermedia]|uniref:Uncharacterized protein n=1 Tax=Hydrogenophaga intermedia TaxID=65786 RepID=A0A1L1PPY0_HYDIT|nr:hypothetical protein [Hydrogenophaga intermedia]CDN87385.1 hypothetical protein BN948_01807 [Hydrogenophaga intermedia]
MNKARFQALISGMTSVAQKVYEGVPAADFWTIHQIVSECGRLGRAVQYDVAQGCLAKLHDAGLVMRNEHQQFKRTPVREHRQVANQVEQKPTTMASALVLAGIGTAADKEPDEAPLDRLATLAARARAMSNDLRGLAEDMENAALAAEEHIQRSQAELQEFNALKAILHKTLKVA